MNRRQFIKGICGVFAAAFVPIPKIVVRTTKRTFACGLTLLELAKRHNNTDLLHITEGLSETNEVLKDATWVEKK